MKSSLVRAALVFVKGNAGITQCAGEGVEPYRSVTAQFDQSRYNALPVFRALVSGHSPGMVCWGCAEAVCSDKDSEAFQSRSRPEYMFVLPMWLMRGKYPAETVMVAFAACTPRSFCKGKRLVNRADFTRERS